ncbi:AraC family transcriptional regulator [Oxalobacter vibrioformis]|uniref:AraC family transcriptional regulator n=2 Tax=Oxalobacter vibrioformis TaxID=933080 RepID=A0A9E9M190_9BURK|nr:AraC family transcriptional regulator [Oxalobacter vibrioformis]
MALNVDKFLATQLAAEILPQTRLESDEDEKNISIARVDPDVLDAFLRLLELLEKPDQIPVLSPMIIREIHYRMLIGPQGGFMRMVNTLDSQSNRIAQAITWLKDNYGKRRPCTRLSLNLNATFSSYRKAHDKVMGYFYGKNSRRPPFDRGFYAIAALISWMTMKQKGTHHVL